MAVFWETLKSNIPSEDKYDLVLTFDEVLGLKLSEISEIIGLVKIPQKVENLINEREELRKKGEFAEADKIREEIKSKGFIIEDTENGPKVRQVRKIIT